MWLMSKDDDDRQLTAIVNAIVAASGKLIVDEAELAYNNEMEQLVVSYMTVLTLKHNVEELIDEVVADPMEFKFNCLDALINAVTEE